MRENLPSFLRIARVSASSVNRHDHALTAESFRAFGDQLRPLHRGRVERDLVGAGAKNRANVLDRSEATSYSQRNKHFIGDAAY